jgi:hypothetical protein
MSIERMISATAGVMILLSVLLTHYHHPNWLWLTVFIGANLLQSAFTGFCLAAWLFKKMGVKTEAQLAKGE